MADILVESGAKSGTPSGTELLAGGTPAALVWVEAGGAGAGRATGICGNTGRTTPAGSG